MTAQQRADLIDLWFLVVRLPSRLADGQPCPERLALLADIEAALGGSARPHARLLRVARGLPAAPSELVDLDWGRA